MKKTPTKTREVIKETALQLLLKEFEEHVYDTELQERYDQTKKDFNTFKNEFNQITKEANDNLDKIRSIQDLLINLLVVGGPTKKLTAKLKKLTTKKEEYEEVLSIRNQHIRKYIDRIERYEKTADTKLFTWWLAIQAVDTDTLPWLEWKRSYDKIIF
jgi:Mg2+ and Co2+ transporter CorA